MDASTLIHKLDTVIDKITKSKNTPVPEYWKRSSMT